MATSSTGRHSQSLVLQTRANNAQAAAAAAWWHHWWTVAGWLLGRLGTGLPIAHSIVLLMAGTPVLKDEADLPCVNKCHSHGGPN